jgi:RES domain
LGTSRSLVPDVPADLVAPNSRILEPGILFDRIFNPEHPANSFNPGRGDPTRFAPVFEIDGTTAISTLYVGATRECAFHERIFHDLPVAGRGRFIRFERLGSLHHCELRNTTSLVIAQLFAPDLARWGMTRANLIDTRPSTYLRTARWAEAIYRRFPDIQGLMWSSRLCEPDASLVLFGQRIPDGALEIASPARAIVRDLELIDDLEAFALRSGVELRGAIPRS